MAIKKNKFYAVRRGRQIGIFHSWTDCSAQVHQFPQAEYKSFPTQTEAEAFLTGQPDTGKLTLPLQISLVNNSVNNSVNKSSNKSSNNPIDRDHSPLNSLIIPDSICVDASCLGNPGVMEYRGVHTSAGVEIFRSPTIALGTNNFGEFLAIVHGLTYLAEQGSAMPIYSDSKTALLWTARKKVNTSLKRSSNTQEIWQLVDRALNWLNSHTYPNPLYKWDTSAWGEIPADFGRKK